MAKSFPITGLGPAVEERQDVDIWFSKRTSRHESLQLSLLVRALLILMEKDPDNELSFFSIAGIHGQPFRSWDGISTTENFCAHNEPTFPTWHRPYQLLLEQCIHQTMKQIIRSGGRIVSTREWERAADTWRFPYWDWTTSELPKIVVYGKFLEIQKLDGSEDTDRVRNPFWQFDIPGGKSFQELGATGAGGDNEAIFLPTRATSKWGVLSPQKDPDEPWNYGIQNWAAANNALALRDWQGWKDGGAFSDAICRMFSPGYHSSWESFASTKYRPGEGNDLGFLSLEFLHNAIHRWTGGNSCKSGAGHMSTLGFAAFDPLFWLHHCNVDRLTSIWLLLYPAKFFDSPGPEDIGPGDHLKPFHRNDTRDPWTSEHADKTEPLGYSYDVLHNPSGQKGQQYLSRIRRAINERYGQTRKDLFKFPKIHGKKNDYIVDVIYDRYGFNNGEPYTIHFFLGSVDGEPSLYEKHPNHVDIVYTFSSRVETVPGSSEAESKPKCENCAKQKADGVLSKGQIILTRALLRAATDSNNSELNSLEPGEVNQYLKRHLNWRAVDNNGNEINIEQQLPRTKIFALKGIADHYEDSSRLSSYHDYGILPEPCQGKPGGVGSL